MAALTSLIQPIWQALDEAVVVTDDLLDEPGPRILYVNEAFCRLTGYREDEALGRSPRMLQGARTDRAALETVRSQLRDGRHCRARVANYRKDGGEYLCELVAGPLVGPDGRSAHFIAFAREIAPSRRLFPSRSLTRADVVRFLLPVRRDDEAPPPQPPPMPAELDSLLEMWRDKRGNRALPSWIDFEAAALSHCVGYIAVAECVGERLRYRVFGCRLVDLYGADPTGCYLDELAPTDIWEMLIRSHRDAIARRQPVYAPMHIQDGLWSTEIDRLLLPLSSNGTDVDLILTCAMPRAAA